MASIVKRKNKYSVVYAYFDEAGKRRQRWEAKAPEPAIQEVEEKGTVTTTPESDTAKILELLKNPETAALLKQIVSAL